MTTEQQTAQAVADKLMGVCHCPNCGSPVVNHPDNGCMLQIFADCISDRGNKTKVEIEGLMATCNIDALWDDVGPLISKLEDGDYAE